MAEAIKLKNPVNGHSRHGIYRRAKSPKAMMVIIHGFGEHSGRYQRMMDHLATQKISTFAIDLEGHGLSEPEQGVCKSYDILLGDVTLALDAAKEMLGTLPQFLYGHSMGGGIVLNHGLKKAPDIKGFLVSAPLIRPPEDRLPGWRRSVAILVRKLFPGLILKNEIVGSRVTTIPAEQEMYEQDPLNHASMSLGLGTDIILAGEWAEANAGLWEAPLLLMHARRDQLTKFECSEIFAARAKNCTFMPMDNCEHEMHNDVCREEIYAAMVKFMLDRA